MSVTRDANLEILYRRAFQQGDHRLAQVWFDPAVLDKYRESPNFSVIRTNTIGRVSRPRVWQLDFGIAADDTLIHASLNDLFHRLPEGEREHWAHHVVSLPVSANFLHTQLTPASCMDDGELRPWR